MPLTSPHITPESAPFWAAANQDQLLLRRCLDTGKAYYYPRDHSPFTGSTATDWIVASGGATLHSFSYSGRADDVHCIAYVTLDEGQRCCRSSSVTLRTACASGNGSRWRLRPRRTAKKSPCLFHRFDCPF